MDTFGAVQPCQIYTSNGKGGNVHDVLTLGGICFTSPKRMQHDILSAISKARIAHWIDTWMAQDYNGGVFLYASKPRVVNPSNPSLMRWIQNQSEAEDFIMVSEHPIANNIVVPGWTNSLINKVATFYNRLEEYNEHMNRDAIQYLNKITQRHPYAAAMARLSRRRV